MHTIIDFSTVDIQRSTINFDKFHLKYEEMNQKRNKRKVVSNLIIIISMAEQSLFLYHKTGMKSTLCMYITFISQILDVSSTLLIIIVAY